MNIFKAKFFTDELIITKMRYTAYLCGSIILFAYGICHSFGYTLEADLNHHYVEEGISESYAERIERKEKEQERKEEARNLDLKRQEAIDYYNRLESSRNRDSESSTIKYD